MRFLLDAHVSGPRVGTLLRGRGHDVRALDQEPALEGLEDAEVLALATSERRIVVTFNVHDFPEILRDWATAGRSHAGVLLVYGLRHDEFSPLVRAIERAVKRHPKQPGRVDRAEAISSRA